MDPYEETYDAEQIVEEFVPEMGPSTDAPEWPEPPADADPSMWQPAPGEVPGTGGMLFPEQPEQDGPVPLGWDTGGWTPPPAE